MTVAQERTWVKERLPTTGKESPQGTRGKTAAGDGDTEHTSTSRQTGRGQEGRLRALGRWCCLCPGSALRSRGGVRRARMPWGKRTAPAVSHGACERGLSVLRPTRETRSQVHTQELTGQGPSAVPSMADEGSAQHTGTWPLGGAPRTPAAALTCSPLSPLLPFCPGSPISP